MRLSKAGFRLAEVACDEEADAGAVSPSEPTARWVDSGEGGFSTGFSGL